MSLATAKKSAERASRQEAGARGAWAACADEFRHGQMVGRTRFPPRGLGLEGPGQEAPMSFAAAKKSAERASLRGTSLS